MIEDFRDALTFAGINPYKRLRFTLKEVAYLFGYGWSASKLRRIASGTLPNIYNIQFVADPIKPYNTNGHTRKVARYYMTINEVFKIWKSQQVI